MHALNHLSIFMDTFYVANVSSFKAVHYDSVRHRQRFSQTTTRGKWGHYNRIGVCLIKKKRERKKGRSRRRQEKQWGEDKAATTLHLIKVLKEGDQKQEKKKIKSSFLFIYGENGFFPPK